MLHNDLEENILYKYKLTCLMWWLVFFFFLEWMWWLVQILCYSKVYDEN